MLRQALMAIGLLVLVLGACDRTGMNLPSSDYEIIDLIAQ